MQAGALVWIPFGCPYRWADMEVQMKTTIEISDPLLREARKLAASEGVTLRALVARGLLSCRIGDEARHPVQAARASFEGEGQQGDCREASWDRVRDLAYEGRGA